MPDFVLLLIPLFILVGFIMAFHMAKSPSEKYGHNLQNHFGKISSGAKKSSFARFLDAVKHRVQKQIKDIGKPKPEEKPQPEVKTKKPEVKLTQRTIEPNENKWHGAFFYYENNHKDPLMNCGDYRLGDTYTDLNGKKKYVQFNVEPYIYQGQMYLGLSYPHVEYEEEQKYQVSYEPSAFQAYVN